VWVVDLPQIGFTEGVEACAVRLVQTGALDGRCVVDRETYRQEKQTVTP
jgi:hypothetical protein